MSVALAARRFLRAQSQAVLSTLSARPDGAPFGSLAPFVLDQQGAPWLLLSGLAEHSRNLQANAQLSLFVQAAQSHAVDAGQQREPAADAQLASRGDSQASARLTLVGKAGTPAAGDGTQHLIKMERVQFADTSLALDLVGFDIGMNVTAKTTDTTRVLMNVTAIF